MKTILATVFTLALVWCFSAKAQWTYQGAWPDTSFKGGSGGHGVAVDPDGKVWMILFGNTDSIFDASSGTMRPCRAINVYNPDGTPASIDRIRTITVGGVTDTLYGANNNRGLRADQNGNILLSSGSVLYRVNYQTGEGMNKVTVGAGVLTAVGVDTLGEIFCGKVLPNNQLEIYDNGFIYLGNVTDTTVGFSRSTEVSAEGNDVYWAGYTNHCIYNYHSDNGSFGPYVVQDTLFKGFDCESMGWNPTRTKLWASAGSANDRPNRYPGATTNYSLNTWYGWDPATGQITDSLTWSFQYSTDSANIRPRGIAFSPDGNTAYVCCFGSGAYPNFEKFVRQPQSVKPDPDVIPSGFTLSQNYPNPFNPVTQIKFTINDPGLTTLVVYDMLGREVATLVNEDLKAGAYKASFDASGFASGTYVYTLTSGSSRISKKMMIVK